MDAVSYSHSTKQAQRIKKIIANPDSTSGIITVPKTIASGETVTIPAGRVAVLPNVQVDGVLNIEGEVFIPSGTTFGDLDQRIDTLDSTTVKLTGNSATATKLQTARTINGVAFDGSANINIEDRLGTAIASAATTTIGTAGLGDCMHITGTTTITSFGTAASAGTSRT